MIKQIINWTWCLPQNIIGLFVLLFTKLQGAKTERYNGTFVTRWKYGSGVSLGQFIFVSEYASEMTIKHEYGHTRQSLYLGLMYLLVIGLPSIIWAGCFGGYRAKHGVSYYKFYTEKWANALGGVNKT